MTRAVLVVNANYDVPTKYLSVWTREVLKKNNSFQKVLVLEGYEANRENFERVIDQENPSLVILSSHGLKDRVFGFKENILVSVKENAHVFAGKDSHVLACQVAKELGPRVMQIGGKSFIGYQEDFQFWHNNSNEDGEILNDIYATPTLGPAFRAIEVLLEGRSPEEAFTASQDAYAKSLLTLLTSADPNLNTAIAACTYHDRTHQKLLL